VTSWTIERVEEVESTNRSLKAAARSGAVDRTVLLAAAQSAGRGRSDHGWTSPLGGLYASVLLRETPRPLLPLLAFVAGEAVMRSLSSLRFSVGAWLKWPNDVLIAPPGESDPVGKAGGILVESVSSGAHVSYAVIGLGLNLLTEADDLPGDLDPPAVSFRSFQEEVPDPEFFLQVFLGHLGDVLMQYAAAPAALVQAVEKRLAWRGRQVTVDHLTEGRLSGTLWGLTPEGNLRLDTAGGERILEAWNVEGLRLAS
jgi:BirA family transcriptional regulator, biotin operon repressor / biotin---[acetyl-CoA-carboxylase] ligase